MKKNIDLMEKMKNSTSFRLRSKFKNSFKFYGHILRARNLKRDSHKTLGN